MRTIHDLIGVLEDNKNLYDSKLKTDEMFCTREGLMKQYDNIMSGKVANRRILYKEAKDESYSPLPFEFKSIVIDDDGFVIEEFFID